jgi:hypothetical protein
VREDFVDELLAAIRRVVPQDAAELQLREYKAYLRGSPTDGRNGHEPASPKARAAAAAGERIRSRNGITCAAVLVRSW